LATYAESDYLRPLARRPLAAWALGAHLGEEPYVIGFAFGEGWLTAYDSLDPDRILGDWLVPAPPPHSFEWTVRRSGPQAFLLPLDGVARDDPGTAWLAQPLLMRDIIGVYQASQPDEYFAPVRLATAFDAIVYVDGATPLQRRWGR
jgi:erythromycin esterase-like protein